MPFADRKTGAFREWKEDDEVAEITLPLPPGTTKRELVCVITADGLHMRHVRRTKPLLRVQPLAGPVIPEESTWYCESTGEYACVCIALAKVRTCAHRPDYARSKAHTPPCRRGAAMARTDQERPVLGRLSRGVGRRV